MTNIKDAIENLTKNVYFWDNEGSGRIAQIPRDDYDQALAKLRTEPESSEVRHPTSLEGVPNHKRNYCYQCGTTVKDQKYCHGCGRKLKWPACPDCKAPEQPPAGEFRETVSKFLREFEMVDEARNLYGVRDILLEACDRLDRSEASREDLLIALKRYGEHETGCMLGDACNCGFKAAIKANKKGD